MREQNPDIHVEPGDAIREALSPVVFLSVRSSKYKRAARRRQCYRCGGRIDKGEEYVNHEYRYDGSIRTISFHRSCYEANSFKPLQSFLEIKGINLMEKDKWQLIDLATFHPDDRISNLAMRVLRNLWHPEKFIFCPECDFAAVPAKLCCMELSLTAPELDDLFKQG